ncbi:PAS domain S-box protein [Niallia sp. FSL W8-1348]|uniref:PAS domain S-box protein n=1 Tax=Niallia sp. FSL W8-1348 TaxID=2954656 RepID=UPI0030F68071
MPLLLLKEHLIISLVLLISAIYTLSRIYEHLYIDKLIIKRRISFFKMLFLFFMFSICINSSLYIFVISLLLKFNFYMGTVALVSVVVLFILTIHYIENQLKYQQEQLEHKNNILTINEQHYRSLFENNPDAVFTLDLAGNFIAVNASVLPP